MHAAPASGLLSLPCPPAPLHSLGMEVRLRADSSSLSGALNAPPAGMSVRWSADGGKPPLAVRVKQGAPHPRLAALKASAQPSRLPSSSGGWRIDIWRGACSPPLLPTILRLAVEAMHPAPECAAPPQRSLAAPHRRLACRLRRRPGADPVFVTFVPFLGNLLQEATEQLDISPHSPLVSTALDENGWVCGEATDLLAVLAGARSAHSQCWDQCLPAVCSVI